MPDAAQALIDQTSQLLPRIKITELLMDVDDWTGFTRHFTHLKTVPQAKDRTLLLSAILADAINLGLTKMAESCPGTTYAKLSWLQAWHIRDETYSAALAELVNAQFNHAFAAHWGDGTTSSSDGQRFRAGGRGESTGHVNPKYGSEPGELFYTHISDQYAPFSTRVVNVGVRDSTYVLDGLLYHESDLRIEEHYTDTAGFTDHVFALMHLLGFRFAPRIRDLGDNQAVRADRACRTTRRLRPMIGGTLNIKHIRAHWDEILRLAASIKQGTVTASLMLRKLGSYPRQNGLAVALRELGRIERTLFILDWLQSVELRRRVHAGLNKGEARNALARAVFFNRLGEIRDRSFEQQRYRASGLNLVTAAIVLWNTVYLERATQGLTRVRQAGGRRVAAIPVAAGLGAHQPDRRLRLAAEPQAGGREIQAATAARKVLAYDFFRILRAPQEAGGGAGHQPVRARPPQSGDHPHRGAHRGAGAHGAARNGQNLRHLADLGKDPLGSMLSVGAIYTVGPYLFPRLVRGLQRLAPKMPLFIEEKLHRQPARQTEQRASWTRFSWRCHLPKRTW